MVFIRKSAGRSGVTKVQIAERRDGRNRILEHVGTGRSVAEFLNSASTLRVAKYIPYSEVGWYVGRDTGC